MIKNDDRTYIPKYLTAKKNKNETIRTEEIELGDKKNCRKL
jgi:hypothetical protein